MSEKIQPKVRFSGFTDAWEQRKLGDLADISRGASPRPIQNPIWFDSSSEVGWLRITDVTEQNGRIHHLEQHISKLGQEKTRVLTKPHLLLSIAATVGKPVVNYVQTGVHDGFLIFYNLKANREFVYQWLEMFRPLWQKYGQPGSQVNLNSELVKQQSIPLPSNDEQQEIVNILTKLDNTIALHQSKLEELKTVKKLAMQKIFDQEWRFKGFTDPWEQRKLGDITTSYSGGTPKSKNKTFYSGTIPFIRSGEISSNFTKLFVTNEAIENSSAKYVKKGQLLFALYGATSGEAAISKINGVINQAVLAINFNGNVYFLLTFLKNKKIDILKTYLQGGQGNLSGDIFKKLVITILKISEQEHIGIFFKTIDSLIAANQQKCDQLKKVKKWCMQNLFV